MRCFLLAFFLINFVLISASHAMYAVPQVEQVPVERLLKNLSARQKEAKIDQEKAMLAFQIGRLHSMAYALKTGTASVASNSVGTAAELPFYGVGFSDYRQFGVADSKDSAQKTKAKEHLESAIHHLREAVKLDPSLAQAKLSLAWCLDESGNKKEALAYYRPLFSQFFEREKRGGFLGGSVAAETGGY